MFYHFHDHFNNNRNLMYNFSGSQFGSIGSNRKQIFFWTKAKLFNTQSNVNSTSRLIFGNPLSCQSLEICFNKRCHHFKIWVTDSCISPFLISIKICEQNYKWLVEETKFRAPLKPICISQIICYFHFVFSRQQYSGTALANSPAVTIKKNLTPFNAITRPPYATVCLQFGIFWSQATEENTACINLNSYCVV